MSLCSRSARNCQELSDSPNEDNAKLADELNASVGGPQTDGGWEDWMMWDQAEESTSLKQSSCGQDSLSMEQNLHLSRKRKTTADRSPENQNLTAASEKTLTAPVRGHSVVERRYRTNINAKIADLRDSVPALKATANPKVQSPPNTDSSVQKLNKATILSTAVSYIHDLEKDKRRLEIEVSDLRARLRAMEREDDEVDPTPETDHVLSETPTSVPPEAAIDSSRSSSWENPAQGMIQVPEDMRRLRTAALQAQYAEQPYLTHIQDGHENRSTIDVGESGARRVKQIGKFMVGSFAGLMIIQGFGATERDELKHTRRSLSAPPTNSQWTRMVQFIVTHLIRISSENMQYVYLALKAFLVLSLLGFSLFLYAFCSKPKQRKQTVAEKAIAVPSLASPLELRRNAWLTSIQTVRVPRHAMFPEWAAVNLEALHYVIRQAVGWPRYSQMTGQTEDDEIARVRAWDIAIDAQLMGGDAEISGSRLILTALASGTLPTTPARLMLKALHVRILLWKASKQGEGSLWSIIQKVASLLAAQQWRLAQNLQRAPTQTKEHLPDDAEGLPEHLTALLQLSCNEVLTDHILQRAYNLAWSRPTQEDVSQTDPEMDLVVEDSTIRSPLDAICAWLSSSTLHRALLAGLADNESNSVELDWNYGVALHTAPRASIAQARALAANAVFVNANRRSALSMLSQDFPSTAAPGHTDSTNKQSNSAIFIDSSIPEAVGYDVTLATYCALALSKLDDPEVAAAVVEEALEPVSLGYQNVNDLTWLSYAAAHHLILAVVQRDHVYKQCRRLIAQMIPRLISWVKGIEKCESGLGEAAVCSRCTTWCKTIARIGKHILELNESITNLRASCNIEEKDCTPKIPEASKEPVKGRETASPGGVGSTRRHSRSSQDSGYASGEA